MCFVGRGDLHSELIAIRWMPHQCGPSYDAPADCVGLRSDMLFFTNGFVLWSLPLRIMCSIYSRNALGIPTFNESNVALNFTVGWQGFLKFGFEQSLSMEALEGTRSGQINLFGLESDDLYPFDWYFLYLSSKRWYSICVLAGTASNVSLRPCRPQRNRLFRL